MSQSIEQAIDQLCYEGMDEARQLRAHVVEISNIEWSGDSAKITIDHPDISQWGTGLYLSPEQSAKLTDPKDGIQVVSVGLYLGKKKNNTSGENLYDYWWSAKVFEGIENPKTFWVDITPSSEPTHHDEIRRITEQKPVEQAKPPVSPSNGVNKSLGDKRQSEINLAMCYRISCERLMKFDEFDLSESKDLSHDVWDVQRFKKNAVEMTKELLKGIDELRGHYGLS